MKTVTLNKFIFCILIVLLPGCDKPVYYNIPDEDKIVFNNNDILRFVDNTGIVDSMSISVKTGYNIHDKRYYHQRTTISYFRMDKNKRAANSSILIDQGVDGASASASGKYFPYMEAKNKLTAPYTLSNKQLEGVYKLNLDLLLWGNNITANNVVELYYVSHYGIIQYSYLDGRTFKLELK